MTLSQCEREIIKRLPLVRVKECHKGTLALSQHTKASFFLCFDKNEN
jgi:hypothetical protein